MEYRVLGSFDIVAGGTATPVTAPRQRELLALLLINANTVLSNDRIVDELWRDDPPGPSTLRFHISKLRKLIGGQPSPLVTGDGGYRLELDPTQLDARRFEDEVAAAGSVVDTDPETAAQHIERAGALWRGNPYPGIEYQPFAAIEIRRLQELHLTFLARGMEVEMARGRHADAVPQLEELVNKHPLHEQFWELLMLALYRSGRQAEALRAFGRAKQLLGEELGIDPSAALTNLEEQILLQAPAISYVSDSPGNLPAPASSFIGREAELQELRDLCIGERMVTIIGPGGIGKTRLAIEVGSSTRDHFPDGTWFVDLAGTDDGGVGRTIIEALPIEEQAGTDPVDTAAAWAADKATLVVMDNCEHVIDEAGDDILRLITRCPRLHVLATSRERLGVDGELAWDLDGLALPPAGAAADSLLDSDAVQLLVDRARRADRTFHFTRDDAASVAGLTRALDGIPLALELAAARLRTSTVADMLVQLEEGLTPLGDARRRGPARHQTMQAALEWSYRLLDAEAAELWRRLSVFRGGFDLDAVDAVVPGSDNARKLERLVDVSLLRLERSSAVPRYEMLQVIREYAASLSSPDETADAVARHLAHFDGFAARQADRMNTGERADAIEALRRDHDNLRVAIANARAERSPREVALVANLGAFWFDAGYHDEARAAFGAALGDGDRKPSSELATALEQLIQLYAWSGALERAEELTEQQSTVAEDLDDNAARTRVLASRALLGFITGDYRTAIDGYQRMLAAPDTHEAATVAYVSASLAYLYEWTGEPGIAATHFDQSMSHAERFGLEEKDGIEGDYRGWAAFQRGDLEGAVEWWRTGERAYADLGLRPMAADMLQLQGWATLAGGDPTAALPMIRGSTDEMRDLGLAPYIARGEMLEAAARYGVEPDEAARLLVEALQRSQRIRSRPTLAWALWYGASFAADRGRTEDCAALRHQAERFFREIPWVLPHGFDRRDAEMLTLTGVERWDVPPEPFDAATAGARIVG